MIIFGGGEQARMAARYFSDIGYPTCLAVDDEYAKDGLLSLNDVRLDEFMHIALSYSKMNKTRESVFNRLHGMGFKLMPYVSPYAINMAYKIGKNAFILEANVLQYDTVLGDNVTLWSGNHIGHGTTIGDHTYVASHVVFSGHCKVGKRCFFGVNSCVKDFTTIGDDCFITMGAIVTKDMPDGSVAVGRDIIVGDKAEKIKAKYFGV